VEIPIDSLHGIEGALFKKPVYREDHDAGIQEREAISQYEDS